MKAATTILLAVISAVLCSCGTPKAIPVASPVSKVSTPDIRKTPPVSPIATDTRKATTEVVEKVIEAEKAAAYLRDELAKAKSSDVEVQRIIDHLKKAAEQSAMESTRLLEVARKAQDKASSVERQVAALETERDARQAAMSALSDELVATRISSTEAVNAASAAKAELVVEQKRGDRWRLFAVVAGFILAIGIALLILRK